ncbi:cyclin-domain-containing protein [Viridothelium virens]|uniref:Cyclin-domain-containing protein n=1 Tax=Viridothelium virens TaxID=1048519 RepID=A0A6A6HG25_VIRVR|nr:cyclin-domain-containing protein [Viridothelium virens]
MDAANTPTHEQEGAPAPTPPPRPNPSTDPGVIPKIVPAAGKSLPTPPADVEKGDIMSMEPESALKLLCDAVDALAKATGDVPPTPPVSRPVTPKQSISAAKENASPRTSRPGTPSAVPAADISSPAFKKIPIGSPEAHPHEPAAPPLETLDPSTNARRSPTQYEAIARKFFSKKPPPISLEAYLERLHRYCPMSTAVYLAGGAYIHSICVEERSVPITARTAHRLVLASLRVAMKALEDLRYPQQRFAGVGGVSGRELMFLEVSLCYMIDFELFMNVERLRAKMLALQQAGYQAERVKSKLPEDMTFKLPLRKK